jgi:small subunit ribosomal protein S17
MGKKKEFIGNVISDKMSKTVVVRVTQLYKHLRYGKIVKKYKKFKVHDEKGSAKIGDKVRIQETRPISKEKRFRVIEIVKRAEKFDFEPKEE